MFSLLLEEIMNTLSPWQNPHSFLSDFREWTCPSFSPEDPSSAKKDYLFQGHYCSHIILVMNFFSGSNRPTWKLLVYDIFVKAFVFVRLILAVLFTAQSDLKEL